MFNWFGKKKRQKRYVMVVKESMDTFALIRFLMDDTPTITAGQYNKLEKHVQDLFVASRGKS